jgi:PAS domain S-box-containing protein
MKIKILQSVTKMDQPYSNKDRSSFPARKEANSAIFLQTIAFSAAFIVLCLITIPAYITGSNPVAPAGPSQLNSLIYGLCLVFFITGLISLLKSYRYQKHLREHYELTALFNSHLSTSEKPRFHSLFESYNGAVFRIEEGRFTDCNQNALEMFHGDRSKVIGKIVVDVKPSYSQDKNLFQQIDQFLVLSRDSKEGNKFAREWKDAYGKERKTEVTIITNHSLDNPHQLVFIRDLSSQRQTELALKASEERFRLMFEKAPVGIITIDIEGNIIDVNPENLKILGSPSAEATRGINVLTFPAMVEAGISPDFANCLNNGTPGVYELEYKTAWGKSLNLRYVLTPLQDAESRITGAISIMEDFTEHKKAREELNRLNKQTQKDAETKALLLKEVNHRVKNNLASIIGMLYATGKFIEKPGFQENPQSTIEALINRIEGMAIVHETLSESNWAPIHLEDLTNRIINNCFQTLPPGIRITKNTVVDDHITVSPKFAGNLGMVINELTTNTIKHSMSDRTSAKITVKISREGEEILFQYYDDGPGFPGKLLKMDGFNTGMYLTQTIVCDGMGGSLALRNENGALTIIRFKHQT